MSYVRTSTTVGNLLKTIADYPNGMPKLLIMDTDGLDTPQAQALLTQMQVDGLLTAHPEGDRLRITDKGRRHPGFAKPVTGSTAHKSDAKPLASNMSEKQRQRWVLVRNAICKVYGWIGFGLQSCNKANLTMRKLGFVEPRG
jgi:hypothetical protein